MSLETVLKPDWFRGVTCLFPSCSISPGNVLTPLWEELAGQSPDAAATIRAGEKCQVSCGSLEEDELGSA